MKFKIPQFPRKRFQKFLVFLSLALNGLERFIPLVTKALNSWHWNGGLVLFLQNVTLSPKYKTSQAEKGPEHECIQNSLVFEMKYQFSSLIPFPIFWGEILQ